MMMVKRSPNTERDAIIEKALAEAAASGILTQPIVLAPCGLRYGSGGRKLALVDNNPVAVMSRPFGSPTPDPMDEFCRGIMDSASSERASD